MELEVMELKSSRACEGGGEGKKYNMTLFNYYFKLFLTVIITGMSLEHTVCSNIFTISSCYVLFKAVRITCLCVCSFFKTREM